MGDNSMIKAVDQYHALGLNVLPLKGRYATNPKEAKAPLLRWDRVNKNNVKGMFAYYPKADIGIFTGEKSGIFVLDVDGETGHKSVSDYEIPPTWTVKTINNGRHYYFKWGEDLKTIKNQGSAILEKVDVRGNGGYVVAPPSKGVGTGLYSFLPGRDPSTNLSECPDWLKKLLGGLSPTPPSGLGAVSGAPLGNRHGTLVRLVSSCFNRGLTEPQVREFVYNWNKNNVPPWDENELKVELEGILRYWLNGSYLSNNVRRMINEASISRRGFVPTTISSILNGNSDDISWVVPGVFPYRSVSIIGGFQKLGKTWLMLDLAIECARGGGNWLGKFPVQGGKVLYFDEESSEPLIKFRSRKLLKNKQLSGDKIDLEFFVQQGLNFSDHNVTNEFIDLIKTRKPTLVLIDSLIRVHRGEENSSSSMRDVFAEVKRVVKETGCTIIFADHERKQAIGESDLSSNRLRGTTEKGAFVDTLVSLRLKDGMLIVDHSLSRFSRPVNSFRVTIEDPTEDSTAVQYMGDI